MTDYPTPWAEFYATGSVGRSVTPSVPAVGLTERQQAVGKFDLATLTIDRYGNERVTTRDGWDVWLDRNLEPRTWVIDWSRLTVRIAWPEPGPGELLDRVDAALREVLDVGRQRDLAHAHLRRRILRMADDLGLPRQDYVVPA